LETYGGILTPFPRRLSYRKLRRLFLPIAEGQAAGALDVALRAKIGGSYQPKAAVWKEWEKEMPWNGETEKAYFIPWTEITPENADALLKHQKKLISGS
jgi:hypothetical protein